MREITSSSAWLLAASLLVLAGVLLLADFFFLFAGGFAVSSSSFLPFSETGLAAGLPSAWWVTLLSCFCFGSNKRITGESSRLVDRDGGKLGCVGGFTSPRSGLEYVASLFWIGISFSPSFTFLSSFFPSLEQVTFCLVKEISKCGDMWSGKMNIGKYAFTLGGLLLLEEELLEEELLEEELLDEELLDEELYLDFFLLLFLFLFLFFFFFLSSSLSSSPSSSSLSLLLFPLLALLFFLLFCVFFLFLLVLFCWQYGGGENGFCE